MRLRGWIGALAAFVLIAAGTDYAVTRWAVYGNPSGDAGRLHHLFEEHGSEIPIFGASKVYYDYVPAEMGLDAYNYGLDGSSYDVVDAFLDIELAKHKTSPIIIDLKPQSEHGIGDPSTYVPFAFDAHIRALLERGDAMSWRYYLPGLRYFGYYDYYVKELINDRAQLMRRVERGFSYEKFWTFDRVRLDDAIRRRIEGPNGYFPDEAQNARLIERIRAHPERLFFLVYSPVHPACFVNFRNAAQFIEFKHRLSELPNAVVIDFEQPNYPDEWFKDTNHLLYAGATDFSHKLGAMIRAVLATRRAAAAVAAQARAQEPAQEPAQVPAPGAPAPAQAPKKPPSVNAPARVPSERPRSAAAARRV